MVRVVMGMARACAVLAAAVALTGCVSFRPLEPVIAPPSGYRGDTIVPIEFVNPTTIGFRCAERGAKFMMLPGINSNACSSPDLMTMPNPCQTFTGGEFATALCAQLARANGWSEQSPDVERAPLLQNIALRSGGAREGGARPPSRYQSDNTIPVEFVSSEKVALRCAERGAKMIGDGGVIDACADRDLITMPNPCTVPVGGWYADTMCHEMAHANGWPPNHRGGSLLHVDLVAPTPMAVPEDVPPSAPDEYSPSEPEEGSETLAYYAAVDGDLFADPYVLFPLSVDDYDDFLEAAAGESREQPVGLLAEADLSQAETSLR